MMIVKFLNSLINKNNKAVNILAFRKKYLLLPFWALVLLSACRKEEKVSKREIYNGPISELHGINMSYTDSARVVVKMSTETQLTLQNEDKVYPKEVRIFFFDKMGNNTTTLRGDSARFVRAKNLYHIMGRVLINNQVKHETLQTDELFWNPDFKKVYTDKPVDVTTPEQVLHGVGMDANQDFTEYTLRKVKGVVRVNNMPQ
ncbi:LPS export ABC transporter periplasmic protein LptC [Flectobacillus major]|uniref:LPS export ABC transporter periplasmic protein LptC n=1 Tax=Flectobacillus major TaxID=103 RepID=UPI000411F5BC|nr:LPS export ABC transporter periplasmic protein LptC [Flectobacillus major]